MSSSETPLTLTPALVPSSNYKSGIRVRGVSDYSCMCSVVRTCTNQEPNHDLGLMVTLIRPFPDGIDTMNLVLMVTLF